MKIPDSLRTLVHTLTPPSLVMKYPELEKHRIALQTADKLSEFIDFLLEQGVSLPRSPQRLLEEFYGINAETIERERRAFLEEVSNERK